MNYVLVNTGSLSTMTMMSGDQYLETSTGVTAYQLNASTGTIYLAGTGTFKLGQMAISPMSNLYLTQNVTLDLNGYPNRVGNLTLTSGSITDSGVSATLASTGVFTKTTGGIATIGNGVTVTVTGRRRQRRSLARGRHPHSDDEHDRCQRGNPGRWSWNHRGHCEWLCLG